MFTFIKKFFLYLKIKHMTNFELYKVNFSIIFKFLVSLNLMINVKNCKFP